MKTKVQMNRKKKKAFFCFSFSIFFEGEGGMVLGNRKYWLLVDANKTS